MANGRTGALPVVGASRAVSAASGWRAALARWSRHLTQAHVLAHSPADGPDIPPAQREQVFVCCQRGKTHGTPGAGIGGKGCRIDVTLAPPPHAAPAR